MALISSTSMTPESVLSDQVAREDIVEKNDLGQSVVVVAKGSRIPKDMLKAKRAPAENKAKRAPKGSK